MKTILIVEDEIEIAQTLGMVLASEGFAVETAADGLAALDRLSALRPDLMLVDIMMPRMDGRELCRVIKADPRLRDIPLIFMSAAARDVTGPCADVPLVRKPFNLDDLLRRIRKAVDGDVLPAERK